MATTPEQSQQEQEDFSAAFQGDEPVKHEMSEDEAFGLTPETAAAETEDAPHGEMPAAEAAPEPEAVAAPAEEAPAVAVIVEPGAAEDGAVSEEDVSAADKDLQREKSWEGRLKAREAELKAREDALAAKDAPAVATETPAEEAVEPPLAEVIEDAVEKVESGEMTSEQAIKTLSQDFGDDFTKMLGVLIDARASEIAGKTADEKVAGVSKTIDGIVGEIVDDKARNHFESISDVHPDFMEVGESPEFKAYIDAMDETQKAAALQTIEGGSARQINKLLTGFKDATNKPEVVEAPEPADEATLDAAEGVRSKGLKLPEKPEISQDYEEAWSKF